LTLQAKASVSITARGTYRGFIESEITKGGRLLIVMDEKVGKGTSWAWVYVITIVALLMVLGAVGLKRVDAAAKEGDHRRSSHMQRTEGAQEINRRGPYVETTMNLDTLDRANVVWAQSW
jgi:hypothetical protein